MTTRSTISYLINYGVLWTDTPEGRDFWYEVAELFHSLATTITIPYEFDGQVESMLPYKDFMPLLLKAMFGVIFEPGNDLQYLVFRYVVHVVGGGEPIRDY